MPLVQTHQRTAAGLQSSPDVADKTDREALSDEDLEAIRPGAISAERPAPLSTVCQQEPAADGRQDDAVAVDVHKGQDPDG
jgi:hypothetical protein